MRCIYFSCHPSEVQLFGVNDLLYTFRTAGAEDTQTDANPSYPGECHPRLSYIILKILVPTKRISNTDIKGDALAVAQITPSHIGWKGFPTPISLASQRRKVYSTELPSPAASPSGAACACGMLHEVYLSFVSPLWGSIIWCKRSSIHISHRWC